MPSFTVGAGKDYATVLLAFNDLSGSDQGGDVTLLSTPLENVGTNYTLSGTPVNNFFIRTDCVDFDGSNQSDLSITSRVNSSAVNVTFHHIPLTNNKNFDNAINLSAQNTWCEDVHIEDTSTSGTSYGAAQVRGTATNKGLRRFVITATCAQLVRTGFDHPCELINGIGSGATVQGIIASGSNQAIIDCFFFDCNNNAFNGAFMTETNLASDDATASLTPYTSSELVLFPTNNQTKSTSFLATAGVSGGVVGAYLEVSSGVTVTATEILNSFADSSVIDIDFNVSLSVTEVLSPFTDTSTLSITSGNVVLANITETLNAFSDSSTINVSANISATVTEVLNSFLDGSNVTIAKDITVEVTEVLASFIDSSALRFPTNWVDKPAVITSYTTQTPVTTIWTDKG